MTAPNIDMLDIRRRRALWRASHRGTKELDVLIGDYASARVGLMSEADLARFEAFLAADEPRLQRWLMGTDPIIDCEFGDIVAAVRDFHDARHERR